MHMIQALLHLAVVWYRSVWSYPSGLLHKPWYNHMITLAPVKQIQEIIWLNKLLNSTESRLSKKKTKNKTVTIFYEISYTVIPIQN